MTANDKPQEQPQDDPEDGPFRIPLDIVARPGEPDGGK